jgi:phosphatidylglycerophosphatase A
MIVSKLSPINALRRISASVLYIGYFPWGSGTIGSAITVLALWFASSRYGVNFPMQHILWTWIVLLAFIAICFFLTSRSRDVFGVEDAPQIIIDEVAGQLVTFFMVPLTYKTLVLGFLLFRFFDIVKPFPVHHMEDMEDGVGVTMDDVAAGVLANVSLLVIMYLYHLVRGYL